MRLCGFFSRREDGDEDFTAELETHLAMHTEDGVRSGLDPEVARRQALIRLGGVEQTRQAYRERRGLPWLESLVRDFAYSVRTLSKHRGATAIAVFSIGLGIGANATIFSMVSRFVLRPAPVSDPSMMGYTIVVRTAGNPSALMDPVRRQIHLLDPNMAVYNAETMEEHVRTAYFLPHLAAMLFGTFGLIGLVLAIVGLYGVMSYAVSRRTREIGIRIAMGARPGSVEWLVLRQGMVLAFIAVALGWPAAWMLSKLTASFLYGIQPHDALTFAAVPPILFMIAMVACWIPARRAASIDPMKALRTE